jgi:hypothetical protein
MYIYMKPKAGHPGIIRWNTRNGQRKCLLEAHGVLSTLAVNGPMLATINQEGRLVIVDQSPTEINGSNWTEWLIGAPRLNAAHLNWSPSTKFLALSSGPPQARRIEIINVHTAHGAVILGEVDCDDSNPQWDGDTRIYFTRTYDNGDTLLFTCLLGKHPERIVGPYRRLRSLRISPEGGLAWIAGQSNDMRAYLCTPSGLAQIVAPITRATDVAWLGSDLVVAGYAKGRYGVWRVHPAGVDLLVENGFAPTPWGDSYLLYVMADQTEFGLYVMAVKSQRHRYLSSLTLPDASIRPAGYWV